MKRAQIYAWKLNLLRCFEFQSRYLKPGNKSNGYTAPWIAVTMRVWVPWIRCFGLETIYDLTNGNIWK